MLKGPLWATACGRKESALCSGNSADVCASIGSQEAHVAGFDTIMLKDGLMDGGPSFRESALFKNWAFSFIGPCSVIFELANARENREVQQLKLAQNLFFTAEPCRFSDAAWCAKRLVKSMLSISNFTKAMQHYEQARDWRIQEHIETNHGESSEESPLSFEWSRQICLFELARGNDAEQMEVIWDLGSNIASKPLSGHPKHVQRNTIP
ncbi:NB-ARC and TPR domain-containing protein [Penicillium malachiteum]|uniref:NB-ARC and TPR domain-containing protein n=1 Tax=Penicillium malachiteum TaxID=1324776 RepID=UPI00254696BC|nr:NB-ARC and TPR domain-containing protein [Penicillium malachiteum]KAJ5731134.1 NB-ARC and TPR domain-containing protein [Penicillium malachiteum]